MAAPQYDLVQRAFDLLNSIHKDIDYLETTLNFMLGGPSCVAGCGNCCKQGVIVPEVSAWYVAFNVTTLPLERQEVIAKKLERWLLNELPDVRLNFTDDGAEEPAIRHAEFESVGRLWCPFLSEDLRCLIYPWRDITCRAWGVSRPIPDICSRPVYKGETKDFRSYIGNDNRLVSEIKDEIASLETLLSDNVPQLLRRSWLPTLVYRLSWPNKWETIQAKVQAAKIAEYDGLLWIVTEEDVRKVSRASTLTR